MMRILPLRSVYETTSSLFETDIPAGTARRSAAFGRDTISPRRRKGRNEKPLILDSYSAKIRVNPRQTMAIEGFQISDADERGSSRIKQNLVCPHVVFGFISENHMKSAWICVEFFFASFAPSQ
jgi:hypothetical protein